MKGTRLGEFEEVVLLVVGQFAEDDASSVRIQEALESHAGRKASLGAIYTVLERLERKAWVTSWLSKTKPKQGRARRCYRLTQNGRIELAQQRKVRELLWGRLVTPKQAEA